MNVMKKLLQKSLTILIISGVLSSLPLLALEADRADARHALSPEKGGLLASEPSVGSVLPLGAATVKEVQGRTGDGAPTRVGDDNYLMTACHVGHNAQLGNSVTMTNCASLAGHATVGDRCVFSGYVGVHQFTRVGELVMMRASGGVSMHVPPYLVVSDINVAAGLNKVGLERSPDLTDEDRAQIKRVYRAVYRDRGARSLERTVESLDATDLRPAARKFVDFIARALADEGRHARGIIRHR